MRTWGELKNEVLGLIFSNNTGGEKVSTQAAFVQEYIINMPDAANCVFRELAAISPFRKSVVFTTDFRNTEFDMLKECNDFMTFLDDGVYYLDGEIPEKANNYFIRGGSKITFTGNRYGQYEVNYIAFPSALSEDTPEEHVLELDDNAVSVAAYYIASRLYAEDDMALAAYYMNIYENKKEELRKLYITSAGQMGGKFTSERGWY